MRLWLYKRKGQNRQAISENYMYLNLDLNIKIRWPEHNVKFYYVDNKSITITNSKCYECRHEILVKYDTSTPESWVRAVSIPLLIHALRTSGHIRAVPLINQTGIHIYIGIMGEKRSPRFVGTSKINVNNDSKNNGWSFELEAQCQVSQQSHQI